MTFRSAIYRGDVVHDRRQPKRHRLRYSVFSLLLDLDELPGLDRGLFLFGYNRWAPLAFFDSDHGATDGSSLRLWAEQRMRDAGIEPDGGPIRLFCYPRVLGFVFNPLSVFFCYRQNGEISAVLYEVCNTFRERHTYVIPVGLSDAPVLRQECEKALYVSPFTEMQSRYRFSIVPPGKTVSVAIRQEGREGLVLAAAFRGQRSAIDNFSISRCLFSFPFMTLKILAAIHVEAARLWCKGLRVFPHQAAASPVDSSVGASTVTTSRNR